MTEVFKMSWDKIKNGSRVGSKVSNHRRSPSLEAVSASSGNSSKKPKIMHKTKGTIDFFIPKPKESFVHHMLKLEKLDDLFLKKIVLKRSHFTYI